MRTCTRATKLPWGAALAGFDELGSEWGSNRHMQSRCGRTFEDTFEFVRRYYVTGPLLCPTPLSSKPERFMRRTAIEKRVGDDCGGAKAECAELNPHLELALWDTICRHARGTN